MWHATKEVRLVTLMWINVTITFYILNAIVEINLLSSKSALDSKGSNNKIINLSSKISKFTFVYISHIIHAKKKWRIA